MIEPEQSNALIARLNFLPKFPKTDVAHFQELSWALQAATDVELAKLVIDEFCQESTECPLPADIHRLVRYHVERKEEKLALLRDQALREQWLNPKCPKCQDWGFVIKIIGGVQGAEQCECRRSS